MNTGRRRTPLDTHTQRDSGTNSGIARAPLLQSGGPTDGGIEHIMTTSSVTHRRYARTVQPARLLERIRGGHVRNIAFSDLVALVEALRFQEVGGRGSHRVFARPGIAELVNLQAERGQAKPYQVRQVVVLVRRYDLQLEDRT